MSIFGKIIDLLKAKSRKNYNEICNNEIKETNTVLKEREAGLKCVQEIANFPQECNNYKKLVKCADERIYKQKMKNKIVD